MAELVNKGAEYDSDEELYPAKVEVKEQEVEAEPEEDTTLGMWSHRLSSQLCPAPIFA